MDAGLVGLKSTLSQMLSINQATHRCGLCAVWSKWRVIVHRRKPLTSPPVGRSMISSSNKTPPAFYGESAAYCAPWCGRCGWEYDGRIIAASMTKHLTILNVARGKLQLTGEELSHSAEHLVTSRRHRLYTVNENGVYVAKLTLFIDLIILVAL